MSTRNDQEVLRALAERYAEIAALPVQEEKRRLWTDHLSLKPTRVPILATYGMWNVWCREVFADEAMACRDPFYRSYERTLRMALFPQTRAANTGHFCRGRTGRVIPKRRVTPRPPQVAIG